MGKTKAVKKGKKGKKGNGKVSPMEKACGKLVDKDHNGRMDKQEKIAFVACLKGAKKGYDGNGDAKVTPDELRCGLAANANHSGAVDKKEIEAFKKCLKAAKPSKKAAKKKKVVKMKVNKKEIKKKLKKKGVVGHDFDGDGKIESNEKQFAKLFDMNDDGMLNKEELKRAKLAWKLARDEFGAQTAYADEYYHYALDDYDDDFDEDSDYGYGYDDDAYAYDYYDSDEGEDDGQYYYDSEEEDMSAYN